MTALRSLLFLILAPGGAGFYIPLALLRTGPRLDAGPLAFLAYPLWLLGGLGLLWCFWDFTFKGHGTPAPVDPPRELVATGLYRVVRNPMYVSVLTILLGHFLYFGYWYLLAYLVVFFVTAHLFVTGYEEPNLRQRFGASYEQYLRQVPRWFPKLK